MSAQQAARLTDPVTHGLGMAGLVGGALLGAAAGGILLAALPVTGALATAVVVGGAIAGGGLSGHQLMTGIQRASGLVTPSTGLIGMMGSPNVRVAMLPAARAQADLVTACHGLFSSAHYPIPPVPPVPIVEGASTIRINGMFAARVGSRIMCGASIKSGAATVYYGGPSMQVAGDWESLSLAAFNGVALAALAGAGLLTATLGWSAIAAFGVVVFAAFELNEAIGAVGDHLGHGWGDILQGLFGLLGLFAILRSLKRSASTKKACPEEFSPTPPTKSPSDRLAAIKKRNRRRLLQKEIEKADRQGRLEKLDPADREWIKQDSTGRRKELAYDPDQKSYKPAEARTAMRAESQGLIKGPAERAFDESGSSGGADYIDGDGVAWDVKDGSRSSADQIVTAASPPTPENVLVDCSNMSAESQVALESQVTEQMAVDGGRVLFVK